MGEQEFRQRIARVQRIENIEKAKDKKEDKKDISEIKPVIGNIKKNIENFRNSTKEIVDEER